MTTYLQEPLYQANNTVVGEKYPLQGVAHVRKNETERSVKGKRCGIPEKGGWHQHNLSQDSWLMKHGIKLLRIPLQE